MGKLYIIPTPVGNLEDMTLRGIRILSEVSLILAEDTRTSSVLLRHFNISTRVIAYHQHNEHKVTDNLVEQILSGSDMALITDAGTPGISDPGYLMVHACVNAGVEVECLPGPTAFVPALVVSGLPCDEFYFCGFLPHKKGRETKIRKLASIDRTIVLYESPHRLLKALEQFMQFMGKGRRCSVSREISKKFEETARGTLEEVHAHFSAKTIKGEIVIVIEGNTSDTVKENEASA